MLLIYVIDNLLSEFVYTKSSFFTLNVCFICHQLDKFLPNRSAMDFDYAHYLLTKGAKGKENPIVFSPSREA
jgi:hypothetical protein